MLFVHGSEPVKRIPIERIGSVDISLAIAVAAMAIVSSMFQYAEICMMFTRNRISGVLSTLTIFATAALLSEMELLLALILAFTTTSSVFFVLLEGARELRSVTCILVSTIVGAIQVASARADDRFNSDVEYVLATIGIASISVAAGMGKHTLVAIQCVEVTILAVLTVKLWIDA